MALTTDCNSLPERNKVAPQGESTQQLFPYNGIAINTLVMCQYRHVGLCDLIDYGINRL